MGLANVVVGLVNAADPRCWRSPYDFESPDLGRRERLVRLEYAALQAWRQSSYQADRDELEYALSECRELLHLGTLEGELAERAQVQQRIARVVRVVRYHEGRFTRMNRHYWWIPFGVGLLLMVSCGIHCFPGMW